MIATGSRLEGYEKEYVNEYALIQRMKKVQEVIPREGAKVFLALNKQNKVPPWVLKMTNLRDMELAAN